MLQLIKKFKNKCNIFLFIGSLKEGFRFKLLDVDVMYWLINWKVIGDLFQFMDFQIFFVDVIFMEYCEILLGYVLLKFLILKLFLFQKVIVNVIYKNS